MNQWLVNTPNYVLLERTERIGPELLALDSGQDCIAVYGFSDKRPYDAFCANSQLALTPYPLVKGYLRNRLEAHGDTILVVAIDAESPNQATLLAATMQSVLEAQEQQASQVAIAYRLQKDDASPAYRVEACGTPDQQELYQSTNGV